MTIDVKICGLKTPLAVAAAVDGGAAFIGFNFFQNSPRFVTPDAAAVLATAVPDTVIRVGLFVDATDDDIGAAVASGALDMLQLHGSETPARVAKVKERFALPVMKAIAISTADDIATAHTYEAIADRLLFDAKAPAGATRPGGNALSFDWELIADTDWALPWMLAGGLNAENLGEAVIVCGPRAVDVSSGVEDAPGVKNPDKIRQFLALAQTL
ncbi:MAG: phosphoribosylanthranilate isomerase [Rhodospirillaceae bacterium]|nr:phosphoribosylanthranilate isomerase [Rhodospirillaceae bacterium]